MSDPAVGCVGSTGTFTLKQVWSAGVPSGHAVGLAGGCTKSSGGNGTAGDAGSVVVTSTDVGGDVGGDVVDADTVVVDGLTGGDVGAVDELTSAEHAPSSTMVINVADGLIQKRFTILLIEQGLSTCRSAGRKLLPTGCNPTTARSVRLQSSIKDADGGLWLSPPPADHVATPMCFTARMPYTAVTADEFAAHEGLDDWRVILRTAQATFRCASFPAAAAFAVAVAAGAEAADHHPDIDIRYPDRVRVTMSTHATGGLSTHDVELAHRISAIAAAAGVTAEPTTGQAIEIAIDTMDADRIRPFWAAVMGYQVAKDGAVVDPKRHGPAIWFQQMDEPRTDRDRFHIDVTVSHDEAEARVAATVAAGGRLVSAEFARSWWILADADGNEACVCTWQDRG